MTSKLSQLARLTPLFLIRGGHLSQTGNEGRPEITFSPSCEIRDLSEEIEVGLNSVHAEASDTLQFIIAAGPNRHHSLETAIQTIKDVSQDTQYQISIVLRVDEGEVQEFQLGDTSIDSSNLYWDQILSNLDFEGNKEHLVKDLLQELDPEVDQRLEIQPMGTSYTEVANTIAHTEAEHLIFFAHNEPLSWRIELAAANAISVKTEWPNLESINVVCHGGSRLEANSGKEVISWLVDAGSSLFLGHDGVMETSQGGRRLTRIKDYVESQVGLR